VTAVKIRIKDNSIRLRLTRGEVDTMRDSGVVISNTAFPGGRKLNYALESSPASVNPAAFYSENEIRIRLPETVVLAWTSTEQVSIEGEQILDDGEKLSILVEKDFACLAPRPGEDESDMFANPDADTEEC
jgi:hypothetical protein